MVAEESKLESFAPFDRICDGGATHDQTIVQNTGQVFQLLEFFHEYGLVFRRNIGLEFEKHYSRAHHQ